MKAIPDGTFMVRGQRMEQEKWSVRLVRMEDLPDDALKSFDRFQVTERMRVIQEDGYGTRDEYFTDEWDDARKVEVVRTLRTSLVHGGIVAGAYRDGVLKGFACVQGGFFGTDKGYVELSYLHVSREARHQGIGMRLFRLCCEEARRIGAKKLYVSTHPAVETQRFYDAAGCLPAKEVDPVLLAKEPSDIQLEFDLRPGRLTVPSSETEREKR